METLQSWAEIGERVTEARRAAGLSQADLARRVGMDRTALVRVEAGERRVSALELMRFAEQLDVPPAHLMTRPPEAVVSRRTRLDEGADLASRERYRLDAALQTHVRHAEWLVGRGFLSPSEPVPPPKSVDQQSAVDLARRARQAVGAPTGPLGSLATVAEHLGLYLTVVDQDVDGASVLLDGLGVAVVGGRADPGRRRWTAAHEIGHHLLQDAYHSDVGIGTSRDDREQVIELFAGEFLLPEDDLRSAWSAGVSELGPRMLLVRLAGRYRLSWSAVVWLAGRAGLTESDETRHLRAHNPVRGDFLAVCGNEPPPDLEVGATGEQWKRAVMAAWNAGAVTAARVVELLHGTITADDLPTGSSLDGDL